MRGFSRRRFLELLLAAGASASCDPTGVAESGSGTENGREPVESPAASSSGSSTSSSESTSGSDEDGEASDETGSPLKADYSGEIRTRRIPDTDESIPVVGLGTWQQFDVSPNSDRLPRLTRVLEKMVELGGEVIDSSPMYGRSERIIGQLLEQMGARDEFFLATKVWTRGEEAGIEQMNASMRKFGVETLDLMQVHNLLDWETHLETMKSWKKEGRLRYIGITHYTSSSLSRLADIIAAEPAIDFVQFAYSIETRGAEQRLLKVADTHDVATIVNRPFEGGGLFARAKGRDLPAWADDVDCRSWAQYFLKYVLGDPRVTCVIPGTSDPEHAADNLGAGYGALPDEAQRTKMVRYWEG